MSRSSRRSRLRSSAPRGAAKARFAVVERWEPTPRAAVVRARRQERGERGGACGRVARGSVLRPQGADAGADQRGAATFYVAELEARWGERGSRRFRALARIRTGKNAVSAAALAGG